jgi:hypothetical protein
VTFFARTLRGADRSIFIIKDFDSSLLGTRLALLGVHSLGRRDLDEA